MLSPAQPSPGWMQASVFTSPIWTRLESEVSHHHHSNCITCLLYFQTTTLTTADVHWKVSCTQPYSGSQPAMAHICPRTAKCECSIQHLVLLWITANHGSHLSQDSQVWMQYPALSPTLDHSQPWLTSVKGQPSMSAVSHTQPYSGSQPTIAHICPRTAKCSILY